ncbi:hypothetical protein GCM10010505_29100 [Kitasatospora aburaviensis]
MDDVGRLTGIDRDLRVGVRLCVQVGGVQQQPLHAVRSRQLPGRAGRHQQRGPAVLEQVGDPGGRVARVDGQVGGAGLEHREHRHDQLRRARQGQRHQLLGADTPVDQGVREPVRTGVQLAVGQGYFAVRQGDGGRVRPHLPLEQRGQAALRRLLAPVGTGREQRGELLGGQHVHAADPPAGVGDHGAQQPQPPLDDPGGAGRVEQVGAVLQDAREAVGLFGQDEGQVALGRPGVDQVGRHPQPRQVERAERRVLQGEHGLEQRVVRQCPGRVQRLHQVLERHVLVRVRGQRVAAHPAEQLGERRVAGEVGAQHQGVDEEADQVVQGLVGAPGDRGADRDVAAGAELAQQRGQPGLEHHEEAGPAVAGERPQALVQLGVDPHRQVGAPVGHRRRPGPVERQLDLLRQARQLLPPVAELVVQQAVRVRTVAEQLPLPEGVVGVLDGQRRPLRLRALGAGRVGGRQVPRERPRRPAVSGDVVHHEQQDVLLGRQPEEFGVQRRFLGEVEPVPGRLCQPLRQLAFAELGHPQPGPCRVEVQHPLARHAVDHREDGAQALVPLDQVPQGGLQGALVQASGETQGQRDVVGGARALHAVQEPEPLLREGQRNGLRPVAPPQRRTRPARDVHGGRQFRHRRRVEQVAEPQLHTEDRAGPGDQPGGQQGVPAEVEEALVRPGLGHPEHLGEQPHEQVFGRGARGTARRGGLPLGRRQGPPVELAVRGQRQRVQQHVRGRHHVPGQPVPQVVAQGGVGHGGAGLGHRVGHQPGLLLGAHQHGGPGDLRVLGEDGLDLTELDPEAADLHLVVRAAEELQVAAGVPAHHVPGAVHPRSVRPERVRDEPPCGQPRPVEVAAGQPRARDVQLARRTGRHRPQGAVEHVQPGVGHRPADHRVRARTNRRHHRVDGALGRSVEVEAAHPRRRPQLLPEPFRDGLAARRDHDRTPPGIAQQPVGEEYLEVRRGGFDEVQPAPHGVGDEGVRVGPGRVLQDVQLVASEQGEQLVPGGVEGHRGGQRHPQPRPLLQHRREVHLAEVGEQVEQAAVGRRHALGPSGGARGVDDVRRVARVDGHHRVGRRAAGHQGGRLRVVEHQPVCGPGRGQPLLAAGVRDQQGRPGVVEQVGDPRGRVLGVDRDVRGAGLQHGEDRHHQLRRARQGHRHQPLRARSPGDQGVRQPVGPPVQLRVRQRYVPAHQRDQVRGRPHVRPEELRQALGRGRRHRSGAEHRRLASLLGGEQFDPAHRLVLVAVREGVQQREQPLPVGGEVVGAVRLRRAVQPEQRRVAVPVVEDPDGEVGGRPGHEVVHGGRVPGEARPGVEGHDVDDQRERRPDAARGAEVPQQVLTAVALVGEGRLDLPRRLGDEFAPRHVRPQRQPQRHHVGHRARHRHQVAVGAPTGGDGHGEHHVPVAGQPVDVERRGRDQQPRPPDAGTSGRRPQGLRPAQLPLLGQPEGAVRVGRRGVGEPGRGGQVGEPLGPVGAVGGEVGGRAVGGVAVDQVAQRAERARRHGAALGERRVHLADPLPEHGAADRVQDDVVVVQVPEEFRR